MWNIAFGNFCKLLFCWVYFPPFGRQNMYEQWIKHKVDFSIGLITCFSVCTYVLMNAGVCAFLMVTVDLVCLPLVAIISKTLHNLLFSLFLFFLHPILIISYLVYKLGSCLLPPSHMCFKTSTFSISPRADIFL